MRIKTAYLTGPALDWAVAKCGGELYPRGCVRSHSGRLFTIDPGDSETSDAWRKYEPSTDWSQGGPLIEEEGIHLYVDESKLEWVSSCWGHQSAYHGPTPLVAAMRCFAASKLGDEVEIPEELL